MHGVGKLEQQMWVYIPAGIALQTNPHCVSVYSLRLCFASRPHHESVAPSAALPTIYTYFTPVFVIARTPPNTPPSPRILLLRFLT